MEKILGKATITVNGESIDVDIMDYSVAKMTQTKYEDGKYKHVYCFGKDLEVQWTSAQRSPVAVGEEFLLLKVKLNQ